MSTVLENSGGPGSSITLDPEIISMRNKYLKALEGKSFDDMNSLIQKQIETEDEDIKRLSLLAARVYILRLRTLELKDEPTENAMPWSKVEDNSKVDTKKDTEKVGEETVTENEEWRRMICIETANTLENSVVIYPKLSHNISTEYSVQEYKIEKFFLNLVKLAVVF